MSQTVEANSFGERVALGALFIGFLKVSLRLWRRARMGAPNRRRTAAVDG